MSRNEYPAKDRPLSTDEIAKEVQKLQQLFNRAVTHYLVGIQNNDCMSAQALREAASEEIVLICRVIIESEVTHSWRKLPL